MQRVQHPALKRAETRGKRQETRDKGVGEKGRKENRGKKYRVWYTRLIKKKKEKREKKEGKYRRMRE